MGTSLYSPLTLVLLNRLYINKEFATKFLNNKYICELNNSWGQGMKTKYGKSKETNKTLVTWTRREKIFKKYILPHIRKWLTEVLSKDIIRFESVEGLMARFNNKWKTDYGRLCATKNRALFYGNIMLVYNNKDFVPNKYIVGYSPTMFYELEWYSKNVDPLKNLKEVVLFIGTPRREQLVKELKKHGIKFRIYVPKPTEAYKLARNSALGPFFDKLGGIYSKYSYYYDKLEMPEINYYICNYINETLYDQKYLPTKVKERLPVPKHWLDRIAEDEINSAANVFRITYKLLTEKEPNQRLVNKFRKELMNIIKDFKKYHNSD